MSSSRAQHAVSQDETVESVLRTVIQLRIQLADLETHGKELRGAYAALSAQAGDDPVMTLLAEGTWMQRTKAEALAKLQAGTCRVRPICRFASAV